MNTTSIQKLVPTPLLWESPAAERFGSAPIATRHGSGLPFAVSGGSYAPGMSAHLSTLGDVRKDADGVPPRGRPV